MPPRLPLNFSATSWEFKFLPRDKLFFFQLDTNLDVSGEEETLTEKVLPIGPVSAIWEQQFSHQTHTPQG